MITLTLVAILGALLVMVLMQLFKNPRSRRRRLPPRRRRKTWPTSTSPTPAWET